MKRKTNWLAVVLTVCMLLSSCGRKINVSEEVKLYGDTDSKNPLVICVDTEYVGVGNGSDQNSFFNEFMDTLKNEAGISSVVVEYLPKGDTERKTVLQRMRTEIMAGGGPDVFLVNCVGSWNSEEGEALFNFPEKNMEAGLFLPLDLYMDQNTQFTDWSKQTKVVMDAGRSDEGQVIIPLSYTLPVIGYKNSEIDLAPDKGRTMQNLLSDEGLSDLSTVMYDNMGVFMGTDGFLFPYLQYMVGELVDTETEELLFTEDELLQCVETAFALREQGTAADVDYFESDIGVMLHQQLSKLGETKEDASAYKLIPVYSDDGGATASIVSFAAVNRNTKYPEESFAVIDLIMSEEIQQTSVFYHSYCVPGVGIPMNEALWSAEKPVGKKEENLFLNEAYYAELCSVRDQITAVNFRTKFDLLLEQLVEDCTVSGGYNPDYVKQTYSLMERMAGE